MSRQADYRIEAAERDIEDAVSRADAAAGFRWATDSLMLQSESLSSSAIEGVYSSLAGMSAPPNEQDLADEMALANWEMLDAAMELAMGYEPLTIDDLLELHQALMIRGDNPAIAGRLRQGPGWVGEARRFGHGPIGARFIPPPHYAIPELLDDLVDAVNRPADVSPLLHTALVHAQFETIHPFHDGNGRVGRALVQICLGRSGLTRGVPLPISHALLAARQTYYDELLKYQRYEGPPNDNHRSRCVEPLAMLFADCAHDAAQQARDAATRIDRMLESWQAKLLDSRSTSSIWLIAEELVRTPVFTVETMREQTALPDKTVYRCVNQLASLGIIIPNDSRRNTVYTASEVLSIAEEVLRVRSRHADRTRPSSTPGGRPARDRKRGSRSTASPRDSGNSGGSSSVNRFLGQCPYVGPRSRMQCIRPQGHNGQHRYEKRA
ncbi:Fic family protein [Candidatus Poriferisocius sp.]|uniref:Fic family protein n=1 Tax=Candidatus Poriferisocius sp. TaxID=3101276 RepID=UPI003B591840